MVPEPGTGCELPGQVGIEAGSSALNKLTFEGSTWKEIQRTEAA